MVERRTCDPVSRVRVPAGAAGEYSSPGSAFCSLTRYRSTHSAVQVAGNMHTQNMASSKVTLQTGAWLHGVHRTHHKWHSHVTINNAATTLVRYLEMRCVQLQSLMHCRIP